MIRQGHRQAAGRGGLSKEKLGQSFSAGEAGVEAAEHGVRMGCNRLHGIGPTLDEDGHHRLSCGFQLGQEGQLISRQFQAAGVHVLSAVHGGNILGLEGAVVVEFPAAKAAGGAAQHCYNHVRLPGCRHSFPDHLRVSGKGRTARGIGDLDRRPCRPLLQSPAHRHARCRPDRGGVVPQLAVNLVGVGPRHQQAQRLGPVQGQKIPLIFQQHHALPGQLPDLGIPVRRIALPQFVFRYKRLLKEPPAELHLQNPEYRFLQTGCRHQTPFHRFLQTGKARVPEAHIHTGLQRHRTGHRPVPCHGVQLVNGHAVRHDNAPEPILLPE